MMRQEFIRDQLVLFKVREQTFAILQAHHARVQVLTMPIKFTKHGHVAQHVAEGVDLPPEAALHQLAGKF